MPEGLRVKYEIAYLHRDELSEEEIFDEGFTLNDDWAVEESLPAVWSQALNEQLRHHPLRQRTNGAEGPSLEVQVKGEAEFTGYLAEPEPWSYFLQELIQALLEASGQEMPFKLHYLEVENKEVHKEVELEASFVERSISVRTSKAGKPKREKNIAWDRLSEIMQLVFVPDYDYEKAIGHWPKRSGTYLNTGEGLWFEWGKSLTEPKGESSSLLRLKSLIKQLAAKDEE